jgi:hypothetical protein
MSRRRPLGREESTMNRRLDHHDVTMIPARPNTHNKKGKAQARHGQGIFGGEHEKHEDEGGTLAAGRFFASFVLFVVSFSMLTPLAVDAQTPGCDQLSGAQKALAIEILSTLHPYDCCDATIAECLQRDPLCALTWRLAENLCRRVARGEDRTTAMRGLERRARSMMARSNQVKIDLDGVSPVGSPDTPVTLVEYACARCPFCAKVTPQLYQAVSKGPLLGKAKLYFKVFPIRSHEYSKEAGLGFVTAATLGRFWEFALYSYERFDQFCVDRQGEWAAAVGMDRTAFEKLVDDPATRERLVASKREGIVNKVEATPTFFINGRKFSGDNDIEELIDVLEEEHERVTGVQYRNGEAGQR